MSDLFSELMKSVDTLTDEQVNELLSKLEVKRSGSQKAQEQSKDEEVPLACPHCGSMLLSCDANSGELVRIFSVKGSWTAEDFASAEEAAAKTELDVKCTPDDLVKLRDFLLEKRLSTLVIASNPLLLEHEEFTDMLWTVFHLSDELSARGDLAALTIEDASHLDLDAQRTLRALIANWLCCVSHLKKEYPYLFSLSVRENPLEMSRKA